MRTALFEINPEPSRCPESRQTTAVVVVGKDATARRGEARPLSASMSCATGQKEAWVNFVLTTTTR